MKKIMVLGISPGVGKSTFANELGRILGIKVHHLDAYFWRAGWIQAPPEEFAEAQQQIVQNNEWIIEGNYTGTYEIRSREADTIIYLELPLSLCLYRVFKRYIKNIGNTRPDMAPGCQEKLDFEFLKFIMTTYYPRRKKIKKRLASFQPIGEDKKTVILKNKKEIRTYLEEQKL
ncbi:MULTISPECIES: P-loop NTPase family protein [Bacillus]|uniref:Topology modulation protein n=2 Tax=Bacillus TaxID=1386 RepID=A0A0M4G6V1_9BACI|nr:MULTISPECIES: topology modulation protein [Bacillus]ALC80653.1 topology modulation protein [Bacillus gobiensis]MBP1079538.1 adenylate kinase family enzyme [Bacillus capparidis]MED1094940.1 topology modulation protein [Bacillus capparidis]